VTRKTQGLLFGVTAGSVLLGLAIAWTSLHPAGAIIATCVGFLAFDAGKLGARWWDAKHD
jgi:hypothetical protein